MRGKDRAFSTDEVIIASVIQERSRSSDRGKRKCAWEGRRKGSDSLYLTLDSLDISSSFPGAKMLKIRLEARRKRTETGHFS